MKKMKRKHFKLNTWVLLAGLLLPAYQAVAKKRYFGDPAGATGMLKTKVVPSDAGVYIDGKYVGHADQFNGPGQKLYITPGEHEVRFSIAYYQDYSTKVNVEANKTTVIQQSLGRSDEQLPKPPFGRIKIHVKPLAKTAVIVNGRMAGHADQANGPGQVMVVEPGHYKVGLAHAGYKPHVTEFDIAANETKSITAVLEPDSSVPYTER
jgi:hypothetical protein